MVSAAEKSTLIHWGEGAFFMHQPVSRICVLLLFAASGFVWDYTCVCCIIHETSAVGSICHIGFTAFLSTHGIVYLLDVLHLCGSSRNILP